MPPIPADAPLIRRTGCAFIDFSHRFQVDASAGPPRAPVGQHGGGARSAHPAAGAGADTGAVWLAAEGAQTSALPQQAQQAGALGQAAEQRIPVAPQPALERLERDAFERKQHPNRHDCTRGQPGQRLFVLRSQPVIHQTRQMHYNVFCSHDAASLGFDTQSVACARGYFNFSCFLSRTTG
jgi:hypothetical protein